MAGAWGELNGAFKQLLRHIVERQVGGRGGGTDGIRSAAWQHVRRHISIAVAKANAECLCKVLDNSGDHIDPDAAALAQQADSKTCSGFTVKAMRPRKPTARTTTTATTSRTGRHGVMIVNPPY